MMRTCLLLLAALPGLAQEPHIRRLRRNALVHVLDDKAQQDFRQDEREVLTRLLQDSSMRQLNENDWSRFLQGSM